MAGLLRRLSTIGRVPCRLLPLPHPLPLSRPFASKAPSTPEPLQTLDDVSFTWTSPTIERPGDSVKAARVEAARQRAQVKAERGRKRGEERRQRMAQQKTLVTEFRGIRDEDNPTLQVLPLLPPSLSDEERRVLLLTTSPTTASSQQLLSLRTSSLLHRFSKTPADTGSPEVQVAVLSERIANLRTHTQQRRGDVHSRRALSTLEERRRALLKYLRRRNVVSFDMMMKECGVREEEIDSVGRTDKSGAQARRVPRSG